MDKKKCPSCNTETAELYKCNDCDTIFCVHCRRAPSATEVVRVYLLCPKCHSKDFVDPYLGQ